MTIIVDENFQYRPSLLVFKKDFCLFQAKELQIFKERLVGQSRNDMNLICISKDFISKMERFCTDYSVTYL